MSIIFSQECFCDNCNKSAILRSVTEDYASSGRRPEGWVTLTEQMKWATGQSYLVCSWKCAQTFARRKRVLSTPPKQQKSLSFYTNTISCET